MKVCRPLMDYALSEKEERDYHESIPANSLCSISLSLIRRCVVVDIVRIALLAGLQVRTMILSCS